MASGGTTGVFVKTAIKLPAAVRNLCKHGVEALKPQLIQNSRTRNPTHWNPPAVNKRKAAKLRKRSIREGTYGSFDATTGIGWDPQWDVEVARSLAHQKGAGRYRIRPSKTTKRVRTREERAQKIEKNMEDMDEEIAQYYLEKSKQKPVKNFEWYYKNASKKSS